VKDCEVGFVKVAVLMGGRSGEHEVSLQSARYIIRSLAEAGHEVIPIGITQEGQWLYHPDILEMLLEDADLSSARQVMLDLRFLGSGFVADGSVLPVDVVFPVLHGPFGEDGTVQGALELPGIPYVGAGVLGSALGMDKGQMKAAFRSRNLPVGSYIAFYDWEWHGERRYILDRVEKRLGWPVFVKPANLGSSVGITKARRAEEFLASVEEALLFDTKVIVEAAVVGREVEVSVMGNEHPRASVVGEIVPSNEFYDYKAKYVDNKSDLIIPAQLDDSVAERVRELAVEAFWAVDAIGLARVDMFVQGDGTVLLNEINTMPGFTAISMYPKLWEKSGISGPELVNKLVELGLSAHRRRMRRRHKYGQED
jgi:D-alanine-D-alanine ligase